MGKWGGEIKTTKQETRDFMILELTSFYTKKSF